MNDAPTAKASIGLLGRNHISDCPYCHKKHYHDGAKHGDVVMATCWQGRYTLDCLRVNLSCAAPSAAGELYNE